MAFPRALSQAQGEALHAALVNASFKLGEWRDHLTEPPHLFDLTARDAATIRELLADAVDALNKAEKIARH